jgi:hypothetical protein
MSKSIISLTRLASHEQVTIYLIEQQLKCRRFFDDLEHIGLGPYDFEPNLDHLILKNVELDDGTDKTYNQYSKILDKHSKQMQPEFRAIERQAVKMYNELIALNKPKATKRK